MSTRFDHVTRLDGVSLALFQGWFTAVAEEMGATLMRSAHSPNITERLDHSCAVFDANARLVAQAAHIPVHLGSMPRAVEAALALAPFAPGDVVLLNDPFAGGTHLPDLTCVSPVFLAGRRMPDFFVASRAHHADVGGAAPGSLPLAREVYEEGFRIPPVRLMRAGRPVPEVMALLLANVRTPEERRADLQAQLGAQRTGERRLHELARRDRSPRLVGAAQALLDATERRTRAAIRKLPSGLWSFHDVLDGDGLVDEPVRIALTLTLGRGRALFDWTDSAQQTRGPVNAVRAVVTAASMYALRCVLGDDIAVNDGLLRCVEVLTRPGSVLDPLPPAAVGAGNVETSQRLVDVAFGALAKALPARMPAASSGTMNNLLIGGVDPRTGRPFAYYETLGGGHGAGPDAPGESAMQTHMTNTRNTPIESLEHAYPLHVVRTRIRRGSGGAGRRRGGEGIERVIEMRADARVTVIAERRRRGPWGLAGGADGQPGVTRVRWHQTDRREQTLPAKFTFDLPKGAVLTVASPGGGAHGAALPRASRSRRKRS
ncbi:MAG: hydantoinase B/oxoprolinase family protein [Candidatus Eisenbacteria bacterium]